MSDEPDLSEFDDWLMETFGPFSIFDPNPMNDCQKAIVARNVELLMDCDKWTEKVDRFQTLVEQQPDDNAKKAFLNRFCIRFNFAQFDNADGSVSFSGILFPAAVDFSGTEFSGGDAVFTGAKFSGGDADFLGAKFTGGNAAFISAEFSGGDADFIGAKFTGGNAAFRAAKFTGGVAVFTGAKFSGKIAFNRTEFKSEFYLSTEHCHSLNLMGATFHSPSTFTIGECRTLPDFRDTKFDRPPNLSQLCIKERTQVSLFSLNRDQAVVDKWRVLKQLAQDSGDDEKTGQFFANEMAAKLGTEITAFIPLFVSWLYMILSNFGQSYLRPLGWLFALWFGFGFAYYGALPKKFEGWSGLFVAAQLSFQNSLPFISSIGRFAAQPNTDGYVSWFQQQINEISEIHGGFDHFLIPSIIQQAIGAILLFLLILGLRNVFRMK